jgi:Fe-S cluster assembly iron-binding protein IscA
VGAARTFTQTRWYSAVSDLEDMELGMTSACAKRIVSINAKKYPDDPHMLRVAVDSGGCSGFAYQFEMDNEVNDDDKVRACVLRVCKRRHDA